MSQVNDFVHLQANIFSIFVNYLLREQFINPAEQTSGENTGGHSTPLWSSTGAGFGPKLAKPLGQIKGPLVTGPAFLRSIIMTFYCY